MLEGDLRLDRKWMVEIFNECITGDDLCCDTQIVTIKDGSERGENAHQEL